MDVDQNKRLNWSGSKVGFVLRMSLMMAEVEPYSLPMTDPSSAMRVNMPYSTCRK